jgi:hypothetical protein
MHVVRPSRTRLTGKLTGSLAALALIGTLTACGSDDSEPAEAQDPAPTSSSSTATDESSPSESTSESTSEATDEPSVIDDGAQVDVTAFVDRLQAGIENTKYAHIEFTMGGAGGDMKGSGDLDYTSKPPNMDMSMEMGPETVGMLLVDGFMYIQSSQAGGKYIKYDLSDPNNPLGSGLADQLDPAGSIKTFTEALSSVVSGGTEDVDGRELDRYELTIDTTQLKGQAETAGLPEEMQFTVWLDEEDRMAKTSMGLGPVQYDATLSDFDKAVELKAPPADQVIEPPTA